MTLEEMLSDLGTDPLSAKVNGAPLRACINAELKRAGASPINAETPSDQILESIYGLNDEVARNKLLSRKVNEVKGILNFKRVMATTTLVITFALIIFFTRVVRSDQPLTAEEIDLVKTIGMGAFELVKAFFTAGTTQ